MIILGVDPGSKNIGYALINVPDKNTFTVHEVGTTLGYRGVSKLLSILPKPDIIVVEDFTLWFSSARSVCRNDAKLLTVRLIGALEYQMLKRDNPIVLQNSSLKQGCPDSILKRFNLYKHCRNKHEKDACRHVVVYARKHHGKR